MKNLFMILALICATATTSFAQESGAYHFGDKENPDLVLSPTHPGYTAFTKAVANNSQQNTENISWVDVMKEISSVESLKDYSEWLEINHAVGYVYVYCCGGPGWACYARVPYSCEYACNCSVVKDDSTK